MPDLNLDEIEKRCEALRADAVFGHRANRAILDARTDIPALVAEVKRLREEHRMLHRVECNHTSQPIGGPGCICVVANKYAEERIADNALEEAAKIAEAHMEKAEGVDTRVMHRNGTASAIAREIRALKTNKGE